jgi:hypothetical protein
MSLSFTQGLPLDEETFGAYVIAVDGTTAPLARVPGDAAWLKALQTAVGGYVELVAMPGVRHLCLLVDEDGLGKDLPENPAASLLAGQRIVGPAVVLPRALLD